MIIDVDDTAMANQFDYKTVKGIKLVLASYWFLKNKGQDGCYTALAIILDINNSLDNLQFVNERQHFCLTKYYLDGYSNEEIAEMLDIRKQTVNEHLNKGIKRLIDLLEGDGCVIE